MSSRYSRQEAFYGIGKAGQEKINESRIAIIGAGALGTVTADHMARSGVGFIRIVDRDYVELSNLQRQILYTEEDARQAIPKAEAAVRHLRDVNSGIMLEPVVTDFNSSTVDSVISDVDLILDATDNLAARFLLNEACRHIGKDWIYGGAIGSSGMTANFIYGEDEPCINCLMKAEQDDGNAPSCATAGVLNSTTSIISSIQCSEALKILTGSKNVRRTMIYFDLWHNRFDEIPIKKDPDCEVCVHGKYHYYGKVTGMEAVSLCGRDQVQVIPEHTVSIDFEEMKKKLAPLGEVTYNQFTLDFKRDDFSIKLFKNGRAIISHVDDVNRAKSLYIEYIGS